MNQLKSSKLIALYGWFHEFIEDNNIDLVDEFEDGKILIYDNGKVVHSLDLKAAKKMKEALSSSGKSFIYARDVINYALNVIQGKWKLGESSIAKSAYYSYLYTRDVIKGEWKLGEPTIAKNAYYSYVYAKNIIQGEFKLGEPAIATNAEDSYWYAANIIKGRFKLGEPVIAKDDQFSYWYAKDVIKGKWKLGEPTIAKNAACLKMYKEFLKTI